LTKSQRNLRRKQSISENSFVMENENQSRVLNKKFITSFNPEYKHNKNELPKEVVFAI
jgi:hypothetical protein